LLISRLVEVSRRRIAQIWLDHTGHNSNRQYGTSTKSWRFDSLGILTPLPDDQRQRGEAAFQLSSEQPAGKCRRRTPANWQDFETCIIRLRDDRWTSEPAGKNTGTVKPSRRPFYDALITAITKSTVGLGRATIGTWQAECLRRGLIEEPPSDAKETAPERARRYADFRRAKTDLIAAKWIAIDGELVRDLKGCWQ
jgi:hypothetical protein